MFSKGNNAAFPVEDITMSNAVITLTSLALMHQIATAPPADAPAVTRSPVVLISSYHQHPGRDYLHGSFALCSAPDLVWCRPRPAH
jgi:hypothetical protein